jgi:glycosyltransferase involved in cell wall biosynthesis
MSQRRLKVSLIAHEVGSHTMRTRNLASLLLKHFDVEVVTCVASANQNLGNCVDDLPVTVRKIDASQYPTFLHAMGDLRKAATGEVLYALKLRPTSFGITLLEHLGGDRPVLLDVDDWEPYMCYPYSKYWIKNVVKSIPRLGDPNSFIYTWLVEHMARSANQVTSVSRFFQRRYGGVLLPNGCDTAAFNPAGFDRETLRRRWGVQDCKVIMFVGTAQPNKGVQNIAQAIQLLGRPDLRLVIVGWRTPLVDELVARPDVLYWGMHPAAQAPEFLSMADLVVLPQTGLPHSAGQMPMKMFEAMAMELAVVSTPVADIDEVLAGCGLVAASDAPDHLADAIEWLLEHPAENREMGRAARERCQRSYSWTAMERILVSVMEPYAIGTGAVRQADREVSVVSGVTPTEG